MATELKSSHATVIYVIQTDIKVPDWGKHSHNISVPSRNRFAFRVSLQLNGYVMWTAIQSVLHFKVYAQELQIVKHKKKKKNGA